MKVVIRQIVILNAFRSLRRNGIQDLLFTVHGLVARVILNDFLVATLPKNLQDDEHLAKAMVISRIAKFDFYGNNQRSLAVSVGTKKILAGTCDPGIAGFGAGASVWGRIRVGWVYLFTVLGL